MRQPSQTLHIQRGSSVFLTRILVLCAGDSLASNVLTCQRELECNTSKTKLTEVGLLLLFTLTIFTLITGAGIARSSQIFNWQSKDSLCVF